MSQKPHASQLASLTLSNSLAIPDVNTRCLAAIVSTLAASTYFEGAKVIAHVAQLPLIGSI
jgi:hypothetical protein